MQAKEATRAEIASALAEGGVASLDRAGAPVLVADGAPLRFIHANPAALALFGADSLSDLRDGVLAPNAPAALAIAERLRTLPAGVNRIERFDFGAGAGGAKLTFLCRRANTNSALSVLAGLGPRLRQPLARPVVAAAAEPRAATGPEACAELKRQFERRYPGLRPARFLWRTDARNVVTEVTPPLAEIFGGAATSLVGRDLTEAARALGMDPDRRLAAALNGRATFSGIEVIWPIAGAGAAAPVSLGALPAFDREKGFDGWRGFGVIQLDRLREAEPARTEPTVADDAAPNREAPDFSGVVLPFPPARGANATEGREEPGDLVTLAPHERRAFREIARTLGAQGESDHADHDEPTPEAEKSADPSAPAGSPKAAGQEGGRDDAQDKARDDSLFDNLFDSFAVGLAIRRGGAWARANRTLLNWLGCADQAEFLQAGGLDGFRREDGAAGATVLHSRDGQDLAVDIETSPTLWRGAPAEAVTVVRHSSAARLQARVAALETSLRQRESDAADVMAILEASADGVALFNADGALLGLNAQAEKLFGRTRDESANLRDLIAQDDQAELVAALAQLASGGRAPALRLSGVSRAGDALALRVSLLRMNSAGKYCAVFRDLSAARENEIALREAKAHAEAESRAKTEYLTAITHEIRTPLNAILGFTEVIMDERFGPVGNARYKEYLKDIRASGAHVMSLVNDLLDLSKIEAGKLDLNFLPVDVNHVVAECVSLIQPQANRERVITRLALAPRLPPALADERSLRQIVLNLLANAVRYNEPGGQVIVSTTSANGMVLLRVKDTGIGMSEAELLSALEPFRQMSAKTAGGTGLGLPLTKALAEANHAGFVIRSRKNEGTLVEVAFPVAPGLQEVTSSEEDADRRAMERASR
jgi:PAS domain S-box-containing protein